MARMQGRADPQVNLFRKALPAAAGHHTKLEHVVGCNLFSPAAANLPMHPTQVEARLKQESLAEKAKWERELAAHKREQEAQKRQVRSCPGGVLALRAFLYSSSLPPICLRRLTH
jgi:hypothetical protein